MKTQEIDYYSISPRLTLMSFIQRYPNHFLKHLIEDWKEYSLVFRLVQNFGGRTIYITYKNTRLISELKLYLSREKIKWLLDYHSGRQIYIPRMKMLQTVRRDHMICLAISKLNNRLLKVGFKENDFDVKVIL